MAFDGVLKFSTAIDKAGFKTGVESLGGIAKAGMTAVTGAITAATGAVTGLGTAAVKVGTGFESSMAQVIATMGITKDTIQDGVNSFDLLSQAAQDAGANTTFSASEAADALNYLALAGYDAATAADALPAVLDLAAAGGMDLAYASDLATDAMAALGIEASSENLTAFGDQMAVTASKANTSVSQLGEAILTVGGTAKSLAGGTTELNAALGVLANRGIKSAEGGTHLRNMILSLSAPTEAASILLGELGVSAMDADGNIRPLNETFADLEKAMQGMSDSETAEVLSTIFNKTDLASAQAMLAGCGEEFDALTAALGECDGAMQQMADTMNDTLEGDMKSLQSKAEALGISVYDSLDTPLRDLAQTGGEYLAALSDAFETGGFEGAAEALGDILSQAVTKATGYLPKITKLGITVINALLRGLSENAPELVVAALLIITMLGDSFIENLPILLDAALQIIGTLGTGLIEYTPDLLEAALQIILMLVQMLTENVDPLVEAAITLITILSTFLIEHAPELLTAAIELILAILNGLLDNADMMIDAAIEIITVLADTLTDPEKMGDLLEAAFTLLSTIFDAMTDPDRMADNALQFKTKLFDTIKEKLENTDWASLGKSIVDGIMSGLLGVDFNMYDYLDEFGDNWVTGIKDVFGIESPSKVMRDEVGKYLAQGIEVGFTEEMPDVGEDVRRTFSQQLQVSVDEEALAAFSQLQASVNADRFVQPQSYSYITNNYGGDSYVTNQTTSAPQPQSERGGDIIIPVTIGDSQLDTVVVRAAQIANARSGGVTL